jgi:hypothetical protein
MPLTAARANALTAAVTGAFAAIGHSAGTAMPKSKKNTEAVAWELFTASLLLRVADARKAAAQKNAVTAGVIFDHAAHPMPPGTNALVYAGDVVEIAVGVTAPLERYDVPGLLGALAKAGVPPKTLAKAVKAHCDTTRAAHTFKATLATI